MNADNFDFLTERLSYRRLSAFIGGQDYNGESEHFKEALNGLLAADERSYLDSLTERVLGAVFEVSNTLGDGFAEKVYQRALLAELRLQGIRAAGEVAFTVTYKGNRVGDYFADIVVEEVLVIELKCADRFSNEHTAQCLNYLRASGMTVRLLVNFEKSKVEWKRIVNGF